MYPPRSEKGLHLLIVYVLVLVAFVAGAIMDRLGWLPGAPPHADGLKPTFAEAWNIVDRNFVVRDKVNHEKMTQGAIRGMLATLGDTGHTTYLTKANAEELCRQLGGNFEGIGAYMDPTKDVTTILRTMPDSPARQAGLQGGDIIIQVGSKQVAQVVWEKVPAMLVPLAEIPLEIRPLPELPTHEVAKLIRGPANTQVTIKVLRLGEAVPRDFTLTRRKIDAPTVSANHLPGFPIAHVYIQEFGKNTDAQLRTALEQAYQEGVKGLIIDLRLNPGGLKETAIEVTSEFLPNGVVFIERDAEGNTKSIPVLKGGIATRIPLVVLVDGGSASSAEILAGALKDYGRAKLVGTKTYGTGTVLQRFPLSDGSEVVLGVKEWLTPKGNQIWHTGIKPDYKVILPADVPPLFPFDETKLDKAELLKTPDKQFLKALKVLRQEMRQTPNAQVIRKSD